MYLRRYRGKHKKISQKLKERKINKNVDKTNLSKLILWNYPWIIWMDIKNAYFSQAFGLRVHLSVGLKPGTRPTHCFPDFLFSLLGTDRFYNIPNTYCNGIRISDHIRVYIHMYTVYAYIHICTYITCTFYNWPLKVSGNIRVPGWRFDICIYTYTYSLHTYIYIHINMNSYITFKYLYKTHLFYLR